MAIMKSILTSGLTAVVLSLLASLALAASGVDELDETERSELEEKLEEARLRLDEAAEAFGELHSRLYEMETVGSHAEKPMLGVLIGGRGTGGGLEIVGVTPGGGADEVGLVAGDEITSVNNVDLTVFDDPMQGLGDAMDDIAPGDVVSVGYLRDGSFALADVPTRAKGIYIMGMTGIPGMDIEIEGLEAFEEMGERLAERFEDMDFTANIEQLESIGPRVNTMVHQAIRIGGMLRLEDMDPNLAPYFGVDRGVLVVAASDEDDHAGLKSGDVILAVNGVSVQSAGEAYQALFSAEDRIALEILRHGVQEALEIGAEDVGPPRPHSIAIKQMDAPVDVRVVTPETR
jgi:predicted metalloprotease with PDZ domain